MPMRHITILAIAAPLLLPTAAFAGQCITYEQTGAMSGQVVECSRDLRTSYSIETLQMSMMGISQNQNRHVIRQNGEIIAWDLDTLQGTRTADPMADRLDDDSEDIAGRFIAAMGFVSTGAHKTVAGERCEVYSSAQMGRVCLTSDLLLLEQSFDGMGPASFTRTAIEIDRGTEGEPSNYTVPNDVTIRDVETGSIGGFIGGADTPSGQAPSDDDGTPGLRGMLGRLLGNGE